MEILNENAWYTPSSRSRPAFPVSSSLSQPPLPSLTPGTNLRGGQCHLNVTDKETERRNSPNVPKQRYERKSDSSLLTAKPKIHPCLLEASKNGMLWLLYNKPTWVLTQSSSTLFVRCHWTFSFGRA